MTGMNESPMQSKLQGGVATMYDFQKSRSIRRPRWTRKQGEGEAADYVPTQLITQNLTQFQQWTVGSSFSSPTEQ